MPDKTLSAPYRARLFSSLITLDQQQSGWDELFRWLAKGQRAAEASAMHELAAKLSDGQLAILEALKKTGQFLPWELKILELGLATGGLRNSYQRLHRYYLLRSEAQERLKARLLQPIFITALVVAIVLFMAWYFDKLALDKAFLQFVYTLVLLIPSVGLCWGGVLCLGDVRFSSKVQNVLTKIPVINDFLFLQQSYFYTHNLSQCIDSGLALLQSLKLSARQLPDKYRMGVFNSIHVKVAAGSKMSQALIESGILRRVTLPPLPRGANDAKEAQRHIARAVEASYVQYLFEQAETLPALLYALIPLWVLLNLYWM